MTGFSPADEEGEERTTVSDSIPLGTPAKENRPAFAGLFFWLSPKRDLNPLGSLRVQLMACAARQQVKSLCQAKRGKAIPLGRFPQNNGAKPLWIELTTGRSPEHRRFGSGSRTGGTRDGETLRTQWSK